MRCPCTRMPTIRRRSSSLGAGRWSSVPAASTSDIASSSSRPYFFSRRTSSRRSSPSAGLRGEQSLAHGAREDLREQVQVRVDRLRLQRLHRAPAPIHERLADRQGCLDPAVLGKLAVEVGLDVAARQFAHGDIGQVRQQVDLELALHVSQAVRAQPLSDFPLVVLVGELRDGRDFASRRSRPSAAGSRLPARIWLAISRASCSARRTIHALVAAPEADRLGRVPVPAEPHAVAHDAVAIGVLADLPGRLARHTSRLLQARASSQLALCSLGLPRPPGSHRPRVAPERACRLSAARRHGGSATARSVRSRA